MPLGHDGTANDCQILGLEMVAATISRYLQPRMNAKSTRSKLNKEGKCTSRGAYVIRTESNRIIKILSQKRTSVRILNGCSKGLKYALYKSRKDQDPVSIM